MVTYIQRDPKIIRNGRRVEIIGQYRECFPRIRFALEKRNGRLLFRNRQGEILDLDLSINGRYVIKGFIYTGVIEMIVGDGIIQIQDRRVAIFFPLVTIGSTVYVSRTLSEYRIYRPPSLNGPTKTTVYTHLGTYGSSGGSTTLNLDSLLTGRYGISPQIIYGCIVNPIVTDPNNIVSHPQTLFRSEFQVEIITGNYNYTVLVVWGNSNGTNVTDDVVVSRRLITSLTGGKTQIVDLNVENIYGIIYTWSNSGNYNSAADCQPVILSSNQIVLQASGLTSSLTNNQSVGLTLFTTRTSESPVNYLYAQRGVQRVPRSSLISPTVVLTPLPSNFSGDSYVGLNSFDGISGYIQPFYNASLDTVQFEITSTNLVDNINAEYRSIFGSTQSFVDDAIRLNSPQIIVPVIPPSVPFPNGTPIRLFYPPQGLTYYLNPLDPGHGLVYFAGLSRNWSLTNLKGPGIGQLFSNGTIPTGPIDNGIQAQDDWFYDGYSLYNYQSVIGTSNLVYQLSYQFNGTAIVVTVAVPRSNIGTGIGQTLIIG